MPELTEIQKDLQALAAGLKQLEAEYNMFFAGRLPRPPWETRTRIATIVKKMDRTYIQSVADRFQFETLQRRYQTFVDLWDRGLRAREEGRGGPFAAPPPKEARKKEPDQKIVHVAQFHDPMREMDKLHTLYDSLMDARREAGDDVVPFHRFAALVKDQVKKLKESGVPEVAFRVAVVDGKVNFTARALEAGGEGQKKPEERAAPPVSNTVCGLGGFGDVAGLGTLRTVDDLELDRLAFLESSETIALNCGEVDEHIAPTVALNEPVTLGVVEPLDLACDTHRTSPALQWPEHKKRPRVGGLGIRATGVAPDIMVAVSAAACQPKRQICEQF